MLPTQEHIEAIKGAMVSGPLHRSHAGSAVIALIEQLQDHQINITPGTVATGPFLIHCYIHPMRFDKAMDGLAELASINAEGVMWGWKIDHLARVHFAPVDQLP